MCKTGKKNLLNLFGLLENEKKILGGFPVAGMRKKIDVKKIIFFYPGKLGYCPSSSFGSRYNGLYRDRQGWEAGLGAAWGPRHGWAGAQQGL